MEKAFIRILLHLSKGRIGIAKAVFELSQDLEGNVG